MKPGIKQSYQLPDPKDPDKKITVVPTGKVYTPKTDPEWLQKLSRDLRLDTERRKASLGK